MPRRPGAASSVDGRPLHARKACHEHLAAPDGSIRLQGSLGIEGGSGARAVECDADHRLGGVVGAASRRIGDDRGDVRMVVLHLDEGQVRAERLGARPLA